MDGFKKRLNESIQFKLSFSLSLAIIAIALIAGIFSFASAYDEAHELQDNLLRHISVLFDRQQAPLIDGKANRLIDDGDKESRIIIQYLEDPSKTIQKAVTDISLPIPHTLADGLHTLDVNRIPYRVLVKTASSGSRIAVAQETAVRNEIARDSALRTLIPLLILVPILLLIVADLVRKMFQPIASLSAEIDQRAEQELHPVEETHLPIEVRPFAVAINLLLARVDQSMETQRRFIADAAHELRSPLTALSLQAERLAQADMSSPARERLMTLRSGIARGRGLLDQLLSLTKAQAAVDRPKSLLSVQRVYRCVLEDLLPVAEAKQIDIGVVGSQDAQILVNELDVMTIVKNLVDNAIRHTPTGGRVDLSVATTATHVILEIQDTGPGIQNAERERVFDPFYRTLGSDQVGSGLGLSIVKAISDRIGADIDLGFSDDVRQSGLYVRVRVPMARLPRPLQEAPKKTQNQLS